MSLALSNLIRLGVLIAITLKNACVVWQEHRNELRVAVFNVVNLF